MSKCTVEVTDKNAIYVNDMRITNRSTKWGNHTIIDSFKCNKNEVVKLCVKRNHMIPVSKIDDESYIQ